MSKHKPRPDYKKLDNIREFLIDTHAHLDRFENYKEIIEKSKEERLEKIVAMAGAYSSIDFTRELAKNYDNVYYACGLHPYDIEKLDEEYERKITHLAKEDKKFVLVGEFGLDYHGEMAHTEKEQQEAFIKQLVLAHKINKPIALHIRDAHKDAIKILKEHKSLLTNGGIIHCFTGTKEDAKEYLSLGFHLSYSGAISYHKPMEETSLMQALKITPLDKLLIETDAPFLAPNPYRGIINEPKYVQFTAQHIADILNMDINELIKQTTINAKNLLKI